MKTRVALLILLTLNVSKIFSQCNCNTPMLTFPSTSNGITVNLSSSGDVQTFSGASNVGGPNGTWTDCGVMAGPNWVGQSISPFSQTYTFSQPVNNVRIVVSAFDSTENLSFTVNAGTLSTYLCTEGCSNGGRVIKSGNTFTGHSELGYIYGALPTLVGNPNWVAAVGMIIQLNSTTPFTSFTMSGTGGNPILQYTNGSLVGLCVESLCTPPTINVASISSSAICNGQSTTIIPGGATTYTLNPGNLTGSSFVLSPSTTTTYTISGTSGCTSTTAGNAIFTISVNPTPVLSIGTSANTICSGQTATLTVSGANTYTWSNGVNTANNSVSPLVSTTYSVIGTNSFGCSNSSVPKTQLVTVNTTPTVAVASISSTTLCNGSNATITASGATNYTLTDGSNILTSNPFVINPTSNTNYTLTGSSAGGCISNNSINTSITVYPSPTIAISVSNNTICIGQSTTITPIGGIAGSYTLMPGGNTSEPFILSPISSTSYTINGASINGCLSNSSTQAIAPIIVNSLPSINITNLQNALCYGTSTGSITLTTIGGTGSNTITPSTFTNLSAGSYTYTTIDDLSCSTNSVILISEPSAPLSSNNATISANTDCILHDGVATVSVTGGTPAYTVNWSSGATGLTANNLNTGINTYTVIDANGCIDNTGSLSSGGILGISTSAVVQSSINCFNEATGAITFSTTGGGIITYTLINITNNTTSNNSTGIFNNLSAANYSLYVVGIGGCNTSHLFSVNQPTSSINIVGISSNSIACFGGTVAITSSVTGGTPPYNYTWQANTSIINMASYSSGTYTMTATDANSCTLTPQSFTVTQPNSSVSVTVIPTASVSCYGYSTTISANANGGTGAYTYIWQNNSATNNSATYTAGNYTVVAVDANNCISSPAAFSITQPNNALTISVLSLTNTCINQSNGAVTINLTGGTPSYTLLWSNGSTSNTLSDLPLGIITATVTDTNLCMNTSSISIDVVHCVELFIPSMFTPNGDGKNDLFVINGISDFPNNSINIFNRWGALVYSKKEYNNTWDGKSNVDSSLGTNTLPSATYFIIFDFGDGVSKPYHGYVELKY